MSFTDVKPSIAIEGVEESTVIDYFATINQEKFESTAALFAEGGELLAPFEKPIVGQKAIASYLAKEAKGMELRPKSASYEPIENNSRAIKIVGKVKTPLFSVNVGWYFKLNQSQEITSVKIKLLASPQELLGLRNIKG